MPLFNIKGNKLSSTKEEPFVLEEHVQKLTEDNLEEIFGLEFITTEFALHGLRIDTLAFDAERKSFVIIEYKRDSSFSIIDQGFSYLSLLLNNKAEFVLKYNEIKSNNLRKDDFDWSQTRVIFIARSFTAHQQGAINFKDLPIELWEVTRYSNQSVLYNQLKANDTSSSINTLGNNKRIQTIAKEVHNYSEDTYLESRPDGKGKQFFKQLKERVSVIDPNLFVHPVKAYLAFRVPNKNRNIFAAHVYSGKIRVDLTRSEPKDFKDPERKVAYVENSFKFYNQHVSSIEISSSDDLEYALFIIQQAYDRFIKSV